MQIDRGEWCSEQFLERSNLDPMQMNSAYYRRSLLASLAAVLSVTAACKEESLAPPPPMYNNERPQRDAGADFNDGGMPVRRPMGTSQTMQARIDQLQEWGADLLDPEKICAGFHTYSCGINRKGSPVCWGHHERTVVHVPEDAPTNAVQISCGNYHACVLTEDGAIYCWGSNDHGETEVPQGLYKEVAAGGAHTCAISENDDIVCWGAGKPTDPNGDEVWHYGQASPPIDRKWRGITSNQATSCAIALDDGEADCWGEGSEGDCDPPRNFDCGQGVVPFGPFEQITVGMAHACGIRVDGSALCWGSGLATAPCTADGAIRAEYECGQGIIPADVDAPFVRLRAGTVHTCGVTSDYELRCWGWNGFKQTDIPMGLFSQVTSGGDLHTCGIDTFSRAQCWGGIGALETSVPADFPGQP